jgi:hypothetical protein
MSIVTPVLLNVKQGKKKFKSCCNGNQNYESTLHTIKSNSKNTLYGVIKYLDEPDDDEKIIAIVYNNLEILNEMKTLKSMKSMKSMETLKSMENGEIIKKNDDNEIIGYYCKQLNIQDVTCDYIVLNTNDLTNDILNTILSFAITSLKYTHIVFDEIQLLCIIEKIVEFGKIYKNLYKTITVCYSKNIDQNRLKRLVG